MMRVAGAGRNLRRYTLVTGVIFVFLFVVFGPVGLGPRIPLGLGQRVGFLTWYLWMVIVASSLLKNVERPA